MKMQDIIGVLETLAPPGLQEAYDNAGLLVGDPGQPCTGVLVSLDTTEAVIREAVDRGCNLVVSHHPLIFRGLKRISASDATGRTLLAAIRQGVAVYAIHTNLDNVLEGVNGRIARQLGLQSVGVLEPKHEVLRKLVTYVPPAHAESVREALFRAGAGQVGAYSECSFGVTGVGTFKAGPGTQPFVGQEGLRHSEPEERIEVIFPAPIQGRVIRSLREAHPYEEVAYDLVPLANTYSGIGSGVVGDLPVGREEADFLGWLKERFGVPLVRHSPLLGQAIRRVAVCGGAGSFLISSAIAAGAQAFVTADLKYHDFFLADGRLVLADVGHFESEQYTIDLLAEVLEQKFPTFAVLKTGVLTNPVQYF
ncbi:MAG TPA: Nif3-like dinuclear metal center hexameric protein [Chitinophagaceae bacterium]|nr:Nif3-like dinuclear metal center hexameric protein [Chitinophagaceae bacterium]